MNENRKLSLMAVLGSGGHTAEMLKMVKALKQDKYSPKYFVQASTDKMSTQKIATLQNQEFEVIEIPRAREVGQSWISSLFCLIYAFMFCLNIIWKKKPELLLVNGPGTCVPVVYAVRIIEFFTLFSRSKRAKIVFIESICRVESLSLSVKLIWYLVDEIIVQWPDLALKYPSTKYIGKFL